MRLLYDSAQFVMSRKFRGNVLLRVGVIMMAVAVVLAVGVTAAIVLRAGGDFTPAPTVPLAVETAQRNELGSDEKPGTNDAAAMPSDKLKAKTLPVFAEDWPRPSKTEVADTQAPRYYQPQQDAELTLTVESLGLYNVPVINSESPEDLDRGVIHLPETPMPWDQKEQKNVYIAGHRTGYPGTGSRLVFFNLDKLKSGDSVVLKDNSGTTYEYRVSEMFVAKPDAVWAVDPVRGRDMLTLQSCTYPSFENRIIIRADRVQPDTNL